MKDKARNLYYLRTIDALNLAKFEIDKLAPLKIVVNVPLAKINDAALDGTQVLMTAAGQYGSSIFSRLGEGRAWPKPASPLREAK